MANFFRTPLKKWIRREIALLRLGLSASRKDKIQKLETDVDKEQEKVRLLQLKLKRKQLKQKKRKLRRKLRH